jgi:hypothetical protein
MRSFGIVLLIAGVAGFLYCGDQAQRYEPVPDGVSLSDGLRYPAAKWDAGRYASAAGAGIGFLLAMFPKGR